MTNRLSKYPKSYKLEQMDGPKVIALELVSKELNHFGGIADLFRQIGVYAP